MRGYCPALHSARNALLIGDKCPDAVRVGGYKEWHAQGIEILEDEKRLPIIILEPGKAYRREDGSVGQNFYAKEVYDISQTTARDQVHPQVSYDDRLLLKGLIASSPVPIRAVEELPQGRGAMFSAEQNAILVKKGMDAPDIFRCVSLEVANVQLAQSMDGYSRETDGYKAYAVSYMLCKRYGVDAKEYEISKLDGVFQGQVPREDIPAALTDMRDAFKFQTAGTGVLHLYERVHQAGMCFRPVLFGGCFFPTMRLVFDNNGGRLFAYGRNAGYYHLCYVPFGWNPYF